MKKNLSKLIAGFCFLFLAYTAGAQNSNIEVVNLNSDEYSSTFEITIQDSVRLHYHSEHTENIFIKSGSAKMQLGDEIIMIKAGSHLTIPKGTKHAVWVNSTEPLVVISVQSPEFKGNDRHFVDE